MRIEDLQLFERIAAVGSISAAAQELDLPPSVASDRLRRLERDLGCTLLHRNTRSLSLSVEGEHLLARSRLLLMEYQAVRHSVGRLAISPAGTLRITAPGLFGRLYLRRPVKRLLAEFPGLTVDLSLADEVVDYVQAGVDLGVRVGVLQDSRLRARKLAQNRRMLVAAPAYLQRAGRPQDVSMLSAHACLVFARERLWKLTDGEQHWSLSVQGPLSSDSAEVIRAGVLDGLGIGLRSLWDVAEDLRAGRLERVLPKVSASISLDIWGVFPPGRFRHPAAVRCCELLQEELADAGL